MSGSSAIFHENSESFAEKSRAATAGRLGYPAGASTSRRRACGELPWRAPAIARRSLSGGSRFTADYGCLAHQSLHWIERVIHGLNLDRDLFNRLRHDAYWVHLKDSVHCDFSDAPWFDIPTSTERVRRAQVQVLYVVSFFRKYLRHEDDHFLDGPPVDWPEVDAFLKK